MKKFAVFILILLTCFVTACNKAPKIYVVSVSIEESFNQETIYVGDEIDFSEYNYVVTLNNGQTENVGYSEITIAGFSTQTAGRFEMTITYNNKEYNVTYNIVEPTVLSCIYKGSEITLYKGENLNFANAEFTALYTNGKEVNYNLALADVVDSNLELSETAQSITFTFEDKTFIVPCKITYREIEDSVEYSFVDKIGLYHNQNMKIVVLDQMATLVSEDRTETCDTFQLVEASFNRYTATKVVGGSFTTIELYLIGNTVYMDICE